MKEAEFKAELKPQNIEKCRPNIQHLLLHLLKVVAGNHENEENGEIRPVQSAGAPFHPQYEHYESRNNMPRNYVGHDTSQFYQ
jgi:hypothetical protein